MVVFLAHRHNHGTYWRPRKSCQYPGHEGKKIALYCKNPINWQMAHKIREMFVTLVQVGSRKYIFNCSILTPLGYSLLMKRSGINKWGKRVSIRDIYICFVLHQAFTQVARVSLKSCPKNFQELPKSCSFHPKVAFYQLKKIRFYQ